MKIVHVDIDDLDSPLGGGQGRRTAKINGFVSEVHSVTVLSGGHPGPRSVRKYGCDYRYLPVMPFPINVGAFLASLPLRLAPLKYDLLVEDFTSPISSAFTPLYSRAPVIGCAQFLFAREMAAKYHLPFDWFENTGLSKYRYLIAMTPDQARDMQSRAPQAMIRTIPEGIEDDAFGVRAERESYVAFMGRMDWHQKGLDTLSEIAKLIAPIELRVAGEGRDTAKFIEWTSGLENVKCVGRVPGDRRLQFLAGARATVMPSRYETFGMVALESLAVGTPVVCADVPNLEFAAGDVSFKVPQPDAAAYAAHIRRLAAEVPTDSWIAAAKAHAHNFVWSELAKKQLDFYDYVIQAEAEAKARRSS